MTVKKTKKEIATDKPVVATEQPLEEVCNSLKEENEKLLQDLRVAEELRDEYKAMLNEVAQPLLVVIPYRAKEAQGNELELAVKGWKKHFKEDFQIVIVGDNEEYLPEDVIHVHHECIIDNPPLDIVSKLRDVMLRFPQAENIILTNDDIYPVNDFSLTEIQLLRVDGLLTDKKNTGKLYSENRLRTVNLLEKEGRSLYDYGTHTPVFLEVEKLLALFEKYSMDTEAYLITSLYFNTYFSARVPFVHHLENDNFKVGVCRPDANLRRLKELIPRKIWVYNSVAGWSEDFQRIIQDRLK